MPHRPTRRDWLKTMLAGSVISVSGTALGTAEKGWQSNALTAGGEDRSVTRVLLERQDADEQFVFPSVDAIDWEELPDGEYEIVQAEKRRSGTLRRRRQTSVQTTVDVDSDHPTIEAFAGGLTHQGVFMPGSTVPVFIGAANTDGIVPQPAGDPVDVTITVVDPDGQSGEFSETIEDGLLRFEYDTATDDLTGEYTVNISADDSDASGFTSFDLGRKQSIAQLADTDFPGKELTVGVDVTENGDPVDADADVTITYPDGSEETRTVSAQDGIGTMSVTPQETGQIEFETATDTFNRVDLSEYLVVHPNIYLRSQRAGDPVEVFGYVQTTSGPAANEDFDIVVTDQEHTTVADATVTTDEGGLYTFSWDSDSDSEQRFDVELSPSGPDTTVLSETITTSLPDDTTGASLTANYDVGDTAPGEDATVFVELTDEAGDPVSGQDIDLTVLYSFRDVPVEHATVTTDDNGLATYTFTVPMDAPEGQALRTAVGTTVNDGVLTDEANGDIARYETGFSDSGDRRSGQPWDLTVSSTEPPRSNDEPVPNQSMRVFVGNHNYGQTVHDTASVVTDSNGEAGITADLGGDAQHRLAVDIVNDYWMTSMSWIPTVQRFDGTIEGVPDSPSAGETISVSLTDGNGDERTAVALFESFAVAAVSVDVAQPGSPAEITILEEAGGEFGSVEVFAVEDGLVHRQREFFSIGETTTAAFSVTPTNPATGETVTFDGSSSSSASGSLSYEWDLTGDGSVDATGEVVEDTFEQEGDYTVTLTVTDGDGTTDETAQTVSVAADPVDEYRDPDSGEVETSGIRNAVGDWQAGDIDTSVLAEVIAEWSS